MLPAIRLENVEYYYDYGKPAELHVLKNINLEIQQGEYAAFLGPSGCGKSTLLYAIAGIEKVTSGKVLVNGNNLTDLSPKELAIMRQVGIGIIFQNFNLIPSIKNIENIMMPMAFLGISYDRRRKRALELLERLNMADLADRYPYELSGGQQQRLGIARAIANDAPIILADEPIGNLDTKNAMVALDILKEINEKEGKTIVMVTHEPWSLRDVQKIFYIRDGQVNRTDTRKPAAEAKKVGSAYYTKNLFPELPKIEQRVHAFSGLMLRGFSQEEVQRFEYFLAQRFRGAIDSDVFRSMLDKPFKDGGVGLWRQRAKKIATYVEQVIAEEHDLEGLYAKIEKSPEAPLQMEVERIRTWLMSDYPSKLSILQIEQIDEAIQERLRSIIEPDHFKRVMALPRSKGGIGLRTHTAFKIAEKLEMLLGEQQVATQQAPGDASIAADGAPAGLDLDSI